MPAHLEPMTESEYKDYLEFIIPDYARDNVEAGFWDESDALERSRKSVLDLLPEGVKTSSHYMFTVRDGDQRVGLVWMRASTDTPIKTGFIFDIVIDEARRGKGYGKATMLLIEAKAKELGLTKMGLHVFAKNKVAKSLYESLGYVVASSNMLKDLK